MARDSKKSIAWKQERKKKGSSKEGKKVAKRRSASRSSSKGSKKKKEKDKDSRTTSIGSKKSRSSSSKSKKSFSKDAKKLGGFSTRSAESKLADSKQISKKAGSQLSLLSINKSGISSADSLSTAASKSPGKKSSENAKKRSSSIFSFSRKKKDKTKDEESKNKRSSSIFSFSKGKESKAESKKSPPRNLNPKDKTNKNAMRRLSSKDFHAPSLDFDEDTSIASHEYSHAVDEGQSSMITDDYSSAVDEYKEAPNSGTITASDRYKYTRKGKRNSGSSKMLNLNKKRSKDTMKTTETSSELLDEYFEGYSSGQEGDIGSANALKRGKKESLDTKKGSKRGSFFDRLFKRKSLHKPHNTASDRIDYVNKDSKISPPKQLHKAAATVLDPSPKVSASNLVPARKLAPESKPVPSKAKQERIMRGSELMINDKRQNRNEDKSKKNIYRRRGSEISKGSVTKPKGLKKVSSACQFEEQSVSTSSFDEYQPMPAYKTIRALRKSRRSSRANKLRLQQSESANGMTEIESSTLLQPDKKPKKPKSILKTSSESIRTSEETVYRVPKKISYGNVSHNAKSQKAASSSMADRRSSTTSVKRKVLSEIDSKVRRGSVSKKRRGSKSEIPNFQKVASYDNVSHNAKSQKAASSRSSTTSVKRKDLSEIDSKVRRGSVSKKRRGSKSEIPNFQKVASYDNVSHNTNMADRRSSTTSAKRKDLSKIYSQARRGSVSKQRRGSIPIKSTKTSYSGSGRTHKTRLDVSAELGSDSDEDLNHHPRMSKKSSYSVHSNTSADLEGLPVDDDLKQNPQSRRRNTLTRPKKPESSGDKRSTRSNSKFSTSGYKAKGFDLRKGKQVHNQGEKSSSQNKFPIRFSISLTDARQRGARDFLNALSKGKQNSTSPKGSSYGTKGKTGTNKLEREHAWRSENLLNIPQRRPYGTLKPITTIVRRRSSTADERPTVAASRTAHRRQSSVDSLRYMGNIQELPKWKKETGRSGNLQPPPRIDSKIQHSTGTARNISPNVTTTDLESESSSSSESNLSEFGDALEQYSMTGFSTRSRQGSPKGSDIKLTISRHSSAFAEKPLGTKPSEKSGAGSRHSMGNKSSTATLTTRHRYSRRSSDAKTSSAMMTSDSKLCNRSGTTTTTSNKTVSRKSSLSGLSPRNSSSRDTSQKCRSNAPRSNASRKRNDGSDSPLITGGSSRSLTSLKLSSTSSQSESVTNESSLETVSSRSSHTTKLSQHRSNSVSSSHGSDSGHRLTPPKISPIFESDSSTSQKLVSLEFNKRQSSSPSPVLFSSKVSGPTVSTMLFGKRDNVTEGGRQASPKISGTKLTPRSSSTIDSAKRSSCRSSNPAKGNSRRGSKRSILKKFSSTSNSSSTSRSSSPILSSPSRENISAYKHASTESNPITRRHRETSKGPTTPSRDITITHESVRIESTPMKTSSRRHRETRKGLTSPSRDGAIITHESASSESISIETTSRRHKETSKRLTSPSRDRAITHKSASSESISMVTSSSKRHRDGTSSKLNALRDTSFPNVSLSSCLRQPTSSAKEAKSKPRSRSSYSKDSVRTAASPKLGFSRYRRRASFPKDTSLKLKISRLSCPRLCSDFKYRELEATSHNPRKDISHGDDDRGHSYKRETGHRRQSYGEVSHSRRQESSSSKQHSVSDKNHSFRRGSGQGDVDNKSHHSSEKKSSDKSCTFKKGTNFSGSSRRSTLNEKSSSSNLIGSTGATSGHSVKDKSSLRREIGLEDPRSYTKATGSHNLRGHTRDASLDDFSSLRQDTEPKDSSSYIKVSSLRHEVGIAGPHKLKEKTQDASHESLREEIESRSYTKVRGPTRDESLDDLIHKRTLRQDIGLGDSGGHTKVAGSRKLIRDESLDDLRDKIHKARLGSKGRRFSGFEEWIYRKRNEPRRRETSLGDLRKISSQRDLDKRMLKEVFFRTEQQRQDISDLKKSGDIICSPRLLSETTPSYERDYASRLERLYLLRDLLNQKGESYPDGSRGGKSISAVPASSSELNVSKDGTISGRGSINLNKRARSSSPSFKVFSNSKPSISSIYRDAWSEGRGYSDQHGGLYSGDIGTPRKKMLYSQKDPSPRKVDSQVSRRREDDVMSHIREDGQISQDDLISYIKEDGQVSRKREAVRLQIDDARDDDFISQSPLSDGPRGSILNREKDMTVSEVAASELHERPSAILARDLTCPVCNQYFKDPRILPYCCHYYCKECIHELTLKSGSSKPFLCPECHTETTLPQGGINSLQPVSFINQIKTVHKKMKLAEGEAETACEICSEFRAMAYCRQCAQFICSECAHQHRRMRKTFVGHNVLTLNQLKKGGASEVSLLDSVLEMCEVHEQPMNIFCFDCNCCVCCDCTVKSHLTHSFEFIKVAASKMRNHLIQQLGSIKDTQVASEQALEYTKSAITEVEVQKQSVTTHIDSALHELHEIVDDRKHELVTEAGVQVTTKLEHLSQREKTLSTKCSLLQSVIKYTKQCVQHLDDRTLLFCYNDIKNKVNMDTGATLQPDDDMDIAVEVACIEDFKNLCHSNINLISIGVQSTTCQQPLACQHTQSTNCQPPPACQYTQPVVETYNAPVSTPSPVPIYSITQAATAKIQSAAAGIHSAEINKNTNFHVSTEGHAKVRASLKSLAAGTIYKCNVSRSIGGCYNIQYTPSTRGRHELMVTVNGVAITGSPFPVFVSIPPTQMGQPVRVITGLNNPCSVDVFAGGEMIVAELNDFVIMTRQGKKLKLLRGSKLDMYHPCGVAVDSVSGCIFLAGKASNSTDGKIVKLSPDYRLMCEVKNKGRFWGFALVRNEIMACDINNNCIMVYSAQNLTYVRRLGSHGSCPGQFCSVRDISSDHQGNLYVSSDSRIQVLNNSGQFLRSFECNKNGLLNPRGVCVSGEYVYITDWDNHFVSVFTTQGDFVTSFGGRGCQEGKFDSPCGMCVDEDGILYVCDYLKRRIQAM